MTINLTLFCRSDPDDCCYPGIRKPFRIGKWVYAADGPICVRVPAITEKTSTEKVPKANEKFREFRVTACTKLWPECEGEVTENGGYRIPPQVVSSRKIAGVYWLRIAVLGNVFFNPRGKPNDVIQFVCGDLQGLIMPRGEEE